MPLAQQAVSEALGAQAPIAGIDVSFRDSKWARIDRTTDSGDAGGPESSDSSA